MSWWANPPNPPTSGGLSRVVKFLAHQEVSQVRFTHFQPGSWWANRCEPDWLTLTCLISVLSSLIEFYILAYNLKFFVLKLVILGLAPFLPSLIGSTTTCPSAAELSMLPFPPLIYTCYSSPLKNNFVPKDKVKSF